MRIKKVHKKVTYIEDKQRHMANNRKSRRKPKPGQKNQYYNKNSNKYL